MRYIRETFEGTYEEIRRIRKGDEQEAPQVIAPIKHRKQNVPLTRFGAFCENRRKELDLQIQAIRDEWGYPFHTATWSQWMRGQAEPSNEDLEFLIEVLRLSETAQTDMTVQELRTLWHEHGNGQSNPRRGNESNPRGPAK